VHRPSPVSRFRVRESGVLGDCAVSSNLYVCMYVSLQLGLKSSYTHSVFIVLIQSSEKKIKLPLSGGVNRFRPHDALV